MCLTEEEAAFLNSLTELPPVCPPPFPPKRKRQHSSQGSDSLGDLNTSSYKLLSNLTGPPSPLVPRATWWTFDPVTTLASSSWPQKGESPNSLPASTLSPSASPETEPSSEVVAEERGRIYLPPISQSRKSCPSDSLPSLVDPQLSSPSLLPPSFTSSFPTTPTVPSKETNWLRQFSLRPPTANWDEFGSGSSDTHDRGKYKGSLWTAIQDAGVPIYLGTPGFDVLSLCPSALGTYCSPTALMMAFSDGEVFYHAYAAGQRLSKDDLVPSEKNSDGGVVQNVADFVLAEYGAALIEQNNGPHFTFINVKRDANSYTIVQRARKLIQKFQENGITKDKVIVSIPATEGGIQATRELSKEDGILVNLAMVSGMSHAAACAEAGAAWISFHLDRLEKVYKDYEQHPQSIEAIQSTIALFDMHNVDTKIMISGFRDTQKIFEFPGAHGFSLTKEQIVAARLPTMRSCHVPPQSTSSLPESAIALAKDAKWPPRFFDSTATGGSDGTFARYFSPKLRAILTATQKDLYDHTSPAIRDFLVMVRNDVVNYRMNMMRLSDPHIGLQVLTYEAVKGLRRKANEMKDPRGAEMEWKETVAGRLLPDVQWRPVKGDKCDVWITENWTIEGRFPEQWDRREVAKRVKIYEKH